MNTLDFSRLLDRIAWHDYGYANGWTEDPDRVKNCKHRPLETTNEGRCLTRYTCSQCRYTYLVDSSD